MSYLVNKGRRLYYLASVEQWGSVMSWQVEYWIRPTDRARSWEVFRKGEGERARGHMETKLADEVRDYVRRELGVEVSDEDWDEMGWTERVAEDVAQARARDVVEREQRAADARAAVSRELHEELEREAALEQAAFASFNAASQYMETLRRKGKKPSRG